jgi:hypothetical protein
VARPLSPWVGVAYADAAGRPVAGWRYRAEGDGTRDGVVGTGGQVWLDGLAEGAASVAVGLVGVYGCRWARDEARVGEPVGMSARCVGIEGGVGAVFEVWRDTLDADGSTVRVKVASIPGTVRGAAVEASAPFVLDWPSVSDPPRTQPGRAVPEGDDPPPYEPDPSDRGGSWDDARWSSARYSARVVVDGVHAATSPSIRFLDRAVVTLRDTTGEPLGGATVQVELSSGEHRTLTSDARGAVEIVDVDPGRCTVVAVQPPIP